MGHVVVSKKKSKKKNFFFFFTFLYLGKKDKVLVKKVTIFYWEWGRNSAPRDGQKIPCRVFTLVGHLRQTVNLIKHDLD